MGGTFLLVLWLFVLIFFFVSLFESKVKKEKWENMKFGGKEVGRDQRGVSRSNIQPKYIIWVFKIAI